MEADRLEEAGDDALVRVVTAPDGHARLSVEKLGALGEIPDLPNDEGAAGEEGV